MTKPAASFVFVDTARQLLDRADRTDVSIRIHGGKRSSATRYAVMVGRGMADEPTAWQRWSAAHESAHVILQHTRMPVRGPILAGVCMVLCIVGVVVLALPVVQEQIPRWVDLTLALIAVAACLATVLIAWVAGCSVLRERERDTDQLAARWGYPFTADIAAQMVRTEGRWSQTRPFLPFRTHDVPAERQRIAGG